MAGYVIVDVEVSNPEAYAEYRARVQATFAPYEGEFLVRGGRHEVIEGNWQPTRLVVLRFPSLDAAKAWYASPEYQAILPLRMDNARADLVMVEGV